MAEDALVGDASGDLHSGFVSDVAKNLIEAGVARGYGEFAVGVSDLGVMRCLLRGLGSQQRSEGKRGGEDDAGFRGVLHLDLQTYL